MADSRIDLDKRQTLRDVYRPNRYALDTRFVLRDGGTHPFAVICPGGAYQVVCSYIEGTPIARRLNELGISAFIVYYRVRKRRNTASIPKTTPCGAARRADTWPRASVRKTWAIRAMGSPRPARSC